MTDKNTDRAAAIYYYFDHSVGEVRPIGFYSMLALQDVEEDYLLMMIEREEGGNKGIGFTGQNHRYHFSELEAVEATVAYFRDQIDYSERMIESTVKQLNGILNKTK